MTINPIRVHHRARVNTTRAVNELGIQRIDANPDWSLKGDVHQVVVQNVHGVFANRAYQYDLPENPPQQGMHRTYQNHWAEDLDQFWNPLRISGSPDTNPTVEYVPYFGDPPASMCIEELQAESIALRTKMVDASMKSFGLTGWKVHDIFAFWEELRGDFDSGLLIILRANKNWLTGGDYLPIFFTKENQVAMYVLKSDGAELLVVFENVEQIHSVENVVPIEVRTK